MSAVRAIIKFECSKCEKAWPGFFFSSDNEFCSECSDKKPVTTSKIKFYNRIRELGGVILGTYQGSEVPIKCQCAEGHECNPMPSSVRHGGMCKICAGVDSTTSEKNFRKRITELGGKVLGEYRGNRAPTKCECKNGHECTPMPTSIQRGQGMCKICAGRDLSTAGENFKKRVVELGGKVLGEYRGSRVHVKCECAKGHECNPLPSSVKQGWGICLICVNHDPATAEANFKIRIAELGGKVLGEYRGNRIPVKCECKEGHICHPYPTDIQQGGGMCSSCGLKSEPLCRKIFEELLNCSMRKSRPKWLMWKNGRPLELDGYNEENKIAFEYQGVQHTEYCPRFHNDEEDLEDQQERDIFKAKTCLKRGINLICIPCDYNHLNPEAMKSYIMSKLIKCNMIEK